MGGTLCKIGSPLLSFLLCSLCTPLQESVYTKMLLNQSVKMSVLEVLKKNKPPQGLVQAITVTEKQFAGAVNIVGESVSNVIDTDERLIIL